MKCGFKLLFLNSIGVPALAADTKNRATILPLITFYSTLEEGEVYNWWAENDSLGDMNKLSDLFYTALNNNPLSRWQYFTSDELVKDKDSRWHVSVLTDPLKIEYAKFRKAGLVVSGDVKVTASPILASGVRMTQHLEILRVKNGEKIGESLKITDIPRYQYDQMLNSTVKHSQEFILTAFSDLNEKIEAYQPSIKKTESANLVLTGALTNQQLEAFKQRLQKMISTIKGFQTLSLEREQVVLLIEGVDSETLAQALSHTEWKAFRTQVISTDSKQVVFDVKARTSVL